MDDGKFLIDAVSNFGFPIIITLYLLVRFERKIDLLRNSIEELNHILRGSTRR